MRPFQTRFPFFRRIAHTAFLLVALGMAGLAFGAEPLRVVASFYPMYVMALNVVGDTPGVQVECMTESVTGCLHDYQLTPSNLKTLASADVFIANGAGMETFIEKAVKQAPHLKVIEASKGIKLVGGNPHIWVSIRGAMQETQNIAQGLAAIDPAHASSYEANAARYLARLEVLRREMHAALDALKQREIITFHEAFPYFADEFHLKIVGVVEREPGSEPSAGELAHTIQLVRKNKVKALFAEPQYPSKSAEIIRRETGVPVSILDPAVTGPKEPAKARDSYIKAMEANREAILKALRES
ncbi:MAG: metal ABC transporter substrate-binding protein [Verrucomicrobia bacterium]|nr:metal ABC transporter substrate-binding protein [Verrucomicrobiota bacterium]